MRIVDQHGNPISASALSATQTSPFLSLHKQVPGHPARGLTPARLNQILSAAERGDLTAQHELFADMEERDGHIFAELSKRKRAVAKVPWDIVPPANASKAEQDLAAFAKEALQDMGDLEDLIFDALDGISHGFAALELEWIRVGGASGVWLIDKAHHRPQTWFCFDRDTRTKLMLKDQSFGDGVDLQPFGWLVHTHKAMSGYTSRSGLGRVLVWPYLFKHFSIGDLAEFLNIYGLPIRIGKYPQAATEPEKAALWQAVASLAHNSAGIMPQSMSIELTEAVKGTEKPFEAMIQWCERTQSKAITGSTLTSEAGSTGLGSGLAEVHNEVRLDIRDSDCKQLAGTITRDIIYPLLAINKGFADARRCPRFVFDTMEAEDLSLYADSLPKLVGIGMQIPASWAHEKLRIPHPAENEDVLATQAAQPATPPTEKPKAATRAAMAALVAGKSADVIAFADQDAIDGALADLDAALQPQVEAWLKPALDALAKVSTADAALELLASENPLVADSVLIEAVARAMFVAELVGADSAQQELND